MTIDPIENSTIIEQLITTYRSKLRIDDSYDIAIKFTEIFIAKEDEDPIRKIEVSIESFPTDIVPTLIEFQTLAYEVTKFVEDNSNSIILQSN